MASHAWLHARMDHTHARITRTHHTHARTASHHTHHTHIIVVLYNLTCHSSHPPLLSPATPLTPAYHMLQTRQWAGSRWCLEGPRRRRHPSRPPSPPCHSPLAAAATRASVLMRSRHRSLMRLWRSCLLVDTFVPVLVGFLHLIRYEQSRGRIQGERGGGEGWRRLTYRQVIGGMAWSITASNVDVDVDVFFQENATIGQRMCVLSSPKLYHHAYLCYPFFLPLFFSLPFLLLISVLSEALIVALRKMKCPYPLQAQHMYVTIPP